MLIPNTIILRLKANASKVIKLDKTKLKENIHGFISIDKFIEE